MMKSRRGFTVLELMVSMSVLALMLVLALSIVSNVSRVTASSTPPAFQEARTAFETMARLLGQAMLNTYWDYDSPSSPTRYIRASELHFVMGRAPALTGLAESAGSAVFFQAPISRPADSSLKKLPDLMNSLGFYVKFSTSGDLPAYLQAIQPKTAAWRLWMYLQPSEDFDLYNKYNAKPQASSDLTWFQNDLAAASKNHLLANHVVLLLIRAAYENADGNPVESYAYDSRPALGTAQPIEMHQIPPTLHLTLVVIDQRTADRLLAFSNGASYDLIQTNPPLFTDASQYPADIATLEQHLNSRPLGGIPIQYRIFETAVTMSSAKWSQ